MLLQSNGLQEFFLEKSYSIFLKINFSVHETTLSHSIAYTDAVKQLLCY